MLRYCLFPCLLACANLSSKFSEIISFLWALSALSRSAASTADPSCLNWSSWPARIAIVTDPFHSSWWNWSTWVARIAKGFPSAALRVPNLSHPSALTLAPNSSCLYSILTTSLRPTITWFIFQWVSFLFFCRLILEFLARKVSLKQWQSNICKLLVEIKE